jgi:hypothetical protein
MEQMFERIKDNLFPTARAAIENWEAFPWHRDRHGNIQTWKNGSSQALAIDFFGTIKISGERGGVVDGRDFLYTLFQLGDPKHARPVAEVLFGQEILRYVDHAWSTDEQEQRIAICDLAVQDDAVVKAHAENKMVIGGRHRTQFRNAYLVRLPIIPERIVDVRAIAIDTPIPDVELTLDSIRG